MALKNMKMTLILALSSNFVILVNRDNCDGLKRFRCGGLWMSIEWAKAGVYTSEESATTF